MRDTKENLYHVYLTKETYISLIYNRLHEHSCIYKYIYIYTYILLHFFKRGIYTYSTPFSFLVKSFLSYMTYVVQQIMQNHLTPFNILCFSGKLKSHKFTNFIFVYGLLSEYEKLSCAQIISF